MELFWEVVNGFQALIILTKISILALSLGPGYASGNIAQAFPVSAVYILTYYLGRYKFSS